MSDLEPDNTQQQATVLAYQNSDAIAFEKLVRQYQNLVTSIAYSGLGDFDLSQDVAQQAFVIAWQKRVELEDPLKFSSWLIGITRNVVRNERRKTRHSKDMKSFDNENRVRADTSALTPVESLIGKERAELIWSVLNSLPENYREPLVLFYRESKSLRSVAALLGISMETAKQRLSRGRKMVKQDLFELVEDSLEKTRPKESFVASVMGTVAAVSMTTKTAATAAGIKTVTSTIGGMKMGAAIGFAGAIGGSLLGIAGAVFGSKKSLDSATSNQERTFMWKMIFASCALVALLGLIQGFVAFQMPGLFKNWRFHVALWGPYSVLLVLLIVWGNRRIAKIKQEFGNEMERGGVQTIKIEPVPNNAIRGSLVSATLGVWCWMLLVTAIVQDWLWLAISLAFALAVISWLWVKSSSAATVRDQAKLTVWSVALSVFPQAIIVLCKWNGWQDQLPAFTTTIKLPSFAVAAIILAIGILTIVTVFRRLKNIPPTGPSGSPTQM